MFHLRATLGAAIILSQAPTATFGAVGVTEPNSATPATCSEISGDAGRTATKLGSADESAAAPGGDRGNQKAGNSGIVVIDNKSKAGSKPGEEIAIGEVDGKPGASSGNNGIIVYGKDDAVGLGSNSGKEPDSGTSAIGEVDGKDDPSPKNSSAASTALASPGAAVGFNPQPDPPGRKRSAAAASCQPQSR